MTRGPDASHRLVRAIECAADQARLEVIVEATAAAPWASATFVGARHRVTLRARPSLALDTWRAALPELDLPMRDHLVADLSVAAITATDDGVIVTLDILTVEER